MPCVATSGPASRTVRTTASIRAVAQRLQAPDARLWRIGGRDPAAPTYPHRAASGRPPSEAVAPRSGALVAHLRTALAGAVSSCFGVTAGTARCRCPVRWRRKRAEGITRPYPGESPGGAASWRVSTRRAFGASTGSCRRSLIRASDPPMHAQSSSQRSDAGQERAWGNINSGSSVLFQLARPPGAGRHVAAWSGPARIIT
jgi:hypothetical protein